MTTSQDEPGKADLSARLVSNIKSIGGDNSNTASPILRVTFIIVALANLGLWFESLIPPYQNWGNPNEDGFSYIGVFYATPTTVPVALFLIAGAIVGRGKWLSRARKALYIGIAIVVLTVGFWILQYIANSDA